MDRREVVGALLVFAVLYVVVYAGLQDAAKQAQAADDAARAEQRR